MITSEFLNQIKRSYESQFPDSFISIEMKRNLYHSIFIVCHLGEREDWENGIRHNDPLQIMLQIDTQEGEFSKDHAMDSVMPENLRLTFEHSHYTIKTDSPYLYCQSKKAGGRLTKGNAENIIKTLDKYFSGVKSSLKESLESGLIMPKHESIVRAKIGVDHGTN